MVYVSWGMGSHKDERPGRQKKHRLKIRLALHYYKNHISFRISFHIQKKAQKYYMALLLSSYNLAAEKSLLTRRRFL